MDLSTLVGILRGQAGSQGKVVFNGDFLTPAQVSAVQAGFGLGAGEYLTIDGIASGDIPDPAGGQVVLTAGTVDALSQQRLGEKVVFTVDATQTLQFTIQLVLAEGWQLVDSFPNLTVFPFDQVTASASSAVYATQAEAAYAPWPDQPQETVDLVVGLNLATWLQLAIFGGALVLLEQVINGTDKYKFFGPITAGGGTPYPVMDIESPLLAQSFTIIPDQLSVGDLTIGIAVSAPASAIQGLSLRFLAKTQDLQFGVELLRDGFLLSFFAEPIPGHTFGVNQILGLPGGSGFQQYIPSALTDAFNLATLQSFVVTQGASSAVGMFGFVIGSNPGYTMTLIPDVLVLDGLRLDMSTMLPGTASSSTTVSLSATAQIFPTIFTGEFDFALSLSQTQSTGWQISSITGTYLGSVKLSDLVRAIVGNTALLPGVLSDISFGNFGVVVTQDGGAYSYTLYGEVDADLPVMDTTLIASLYVTAQYLQSGYSVTLKGSFLVGSENFQLELDLGNSSAEAPSSPTIVMSAKWQATSPAGYIELSDIAAAFGFSGNQVPSIPSDLDLALEQADLYYDYTNSKLLIGLESATYGAAVFSAVVDPATQKWQFFFGLNVDKPIPISNLPLIGDILPKEDTVEITQIQVVVASAPFDDALATSVNAIIQKLGAAYPTIPDTDQKGMPAGLGFAMNVAVGSYQIPIMFGAGQSSGVAGGAARPVGRPVLLAHRVPGALVGTAASSDGVLWFNLQKTFGPVSIQKVGVQYKDEKIYVLVNMTLAGAGLSIGLLGFGIGSSISDFDPSFTIDGIDVTYSGGGVEVSGGLRGTINPVNFVGELMVNVESFGIAGLAGYTTVEGSPSMFLYAVLNAPLGGPPFFFVTGVAAGFGFNRDLQVPDVSGVSTFPLVQWAQGQNNPPGMNMTGDVGSQVNDVLQRLSSGGVVAPQVGQYWLAAGVQFTSFEVVNSFALAVVKFGGEFEINLLGTSTIAVPPAEPVMYAELQILASFRPQDGFIGVSGQLTPRSYVLSPDCHLTGGFAYYFWFSGPLQGNFVVTMGGYNPHFTAPDFYPKVPRLGINWSVSDNLVVTGDEYFAVTSAAVMAGGGLSATWSSGGIEAWFNVQADFLMVYQPFHYYLDASVDIGASFTIDLLFTHLTVSIHVGASLEIWGPDFTGEATIDLDIISFTISFGASGQQTQTTISWHDFVDQMLSGMGTTSQAALAARAAGAAVDTSGITIDVTAGLVKSLGSDPSALDFVVSPETVELTVRTSIPIKESLATWSGLVELAPASLQPPITPNEAFGVGPTGTATGSFLPTFALSITLTNPPEEGAPEITLQCVRVFSNVPNALWQTLRFDGHGTPILTDPLGDTSIPNVVTGYRVVPIVLVPDHTLPINIEYLKYTIDPNIQSFSFSDAYVPTSDDFSGQTVETTIMSPTAVQNRSALLPAIHAYLPAVSSTVDVGSLTDGTQAALLAQPVMNLLGEEPAAA